MKIIKPGTPVLPEKWWVGLIGKCDNCGLEGAYDENDTLTKSHNNRIGVRCPTENCKGVVRADKPTPDEYWNAVNLANAEKSI